MWKRPARVTSKAYLRSYFFMAISPTPPLFRPILNRACALDDFMFFTRSLCILKCVFVDMNGCILDEDDFVFFSEARGRSWRLNLQFRRPRCSQTVSRPSMVQSLMQAVCTQPPPPPFLSLQCFSHAPLSSGWWDLDRGYPNFRDASSEPTQDIFKNKFVLSGFHEIMHVWLEIHKTEKT